MTSVKPILERNEAPFFPDYTDDGVGHVSSVIRTCELLIDDEAWHVFTRKDAAALIVSVIAHDLGMMIDTEGFKFLLKEDFNEPSVKVFDAPPWEKLWQDFLMEVRHFDDTKLVNLLGTPAPVSSDEIDPSGIPGTVYLIEGTVLY